VGDVKVVLNNMRGGIIGHVKRDANSVAHVVSDKAAGTLVGDRIWMEVIPHVFLILLL
jgi:hypothetical protein